MSDYNAAERKDIRAAEKAAKLVEAQRYDVVRGLMSVAAGRSYVLAKLISAHIFHTSFSSDPLQMAFAEGERNQGLQLLNDIMAICPDQYILMMRESDVRDAAADARRNRSNANGRDQGPIGSTDDGDEDGAAGAAWIHDSTEGSEAS